MKKVIFIIVCLIVTMLYDSSHIHADNVSSLEKNHAYAKSIFNANPKADDFFFCEETPIVIENCNFPIEYVVIYNDSHVLFKLRNNPKLIKKRIKQQTINDDGDGWLFVFMDSSKLGYTYNTDSDILLYISTKGGRIAFDADHDFALPLGDYRLKKLYESVGY